MGFNGSINFTSDGEMRDEYGNEVVIITKDLYDILTGVVQEREVADKRLKGYMFDSLVFRFKEALARGTDIRVQRLMDLGLTKGEAVFKAAKQNQRDEMRFIQILEEAIGAHD